MADLVNDDREEIEEIGWHVGGQPVHQRPEMKLSGKKLARIDVDFDVGIRPVLIDAGA